MKRKKNIELDVDYIGEQKPLTKEEEKKLSEYFKQRKRKKNSLLTKRKVTT
jgi:hypothetical protein